MKPGWPRRPTKPTPMWVDLFLPAVYGYPAEVVTLDMNSPRGRKHFRFWSNVYGGRL